MGTPATEHTYGLAEGPVWDHVAQRLLWVDIDAGSVVTGRLGTSSGGGGTETITVERELMVDRTVGCVAPGPDHTLLVGASRHLVLIDHAGTQARRIDLSVPAGSRLNDGACDPAGRMLVGTLALDGRRGREALLRLEHDGTVTVIDDDLHLSNGLGWSPCGTTMYSIDSIPGVVWARDYDVATGAMGRRRALIDLSGEGIDGGPDGMCVDAGGFVWVAVWGTGEVRRYTADGHQVDAVTVAAPHVSSVAFAGPDLTTMVITTSRSQLMPQQATTFPDSGRLFVAEPGTPGRIPNRWAG